MIQIVFIIVFFQSDDEAEPSEIDGSQQRFVAHVPVPSQEEVKQALLKRRKQELLEKLDLAQIIRKIYHHDLAVKK